MKIVIFSFFFSIPIILNVLAETSQVESEKKDNTEAKSVRIKKISNQSNSTKWEYPGIKFQEYLQQNPLLEQDTNNQKQEISQHQNYPELKQYSIVNESKKLSENNDIEDKNSELNNQIEKYNYNQPDNAWK